MIGYKKLKGETKMITAPIAPPKTPTEGERLFEFFTIKIVFFLVKIKKKNIIGTLDLYKQKYIAEREFMSYLKEFIKEGYKPVLENEKALIYFENGDIICVSIAKI